MTAPGIELLVVEDSEPDTVLIQEALEEALTAAGLSFRLHLVRDGLEALAFLRQQPPFEDVVLPDMILMDINMPRKNGLDVLHEIKTDVGLTHIPVVMLTTSAADTDVALAYQWQASSYLVKPTGYDQFIDAIQALEAFWMGAARFPPRV
ncbi:response regulator [Deinococcus ruber]|uniref:Response regulator n=1 Tax=Deinococcus ruber TaxID=1848197 RepID=A0A918CAJ6_9DEIO|nr:response regulator [Deinococcus ruber]GGR15590.1 response regulator [Deinococcus ruber]